MADVPPRGFLAAIPQTAPHLHLAGFQGAFDPGTCPEKRRYVRRVMERHEAIEREWTPCMEGRS
jgi:hypothetical protein